MLKENKAPSTRRTKQAAIDRVPSEWLPPALDWNDTATVEEISALQAISPKKAAKPRRRRTAISALTELVGGKGVADALNQLGLVSLADHEGRIIDVNDAFLRVSKFTREELIGQTHAILKSGRHSPQFWKQAHDTLAKGEAWRSPVKNRAKDGSYYWVDVVIVPIKARSARHRKFLSVQIDITHAVNLHVELKDRSALLQAVVESFPGGLSAFDKDNRLILCNATQKRLLNHPQEIFASGNVTLETLLRINAQRGEYGPGDIEQKVQQRAAHLSDPVPKIIERQLASGTHVEIRTTPLPVGGFVMAYLDITDRITDQETIARLAHQDALTVLPNRALFHERMEAGLQFVARGETLALHCINLDRFKSLNDTLGHPIGDQILKLVAERLKALGGEHDTVARLGGDEFAIIQLSPASTAEVEALARRVIGVLSEPFLIGENTISLGATVGVAMSPADGTDAEQLMMNADTALHRTKGIGRGRFGLFEQSMHERLQARHQIIVGLREAIANNGFELHYQPIVNVKTRRISGCEALIRWPHPERGMVPASEFIPIAEECGLIGKIGDWVLKTACEEASHWPDDIWVAVNLSPAQFRTQNLLEKVTSASRNLPLSRLILEITETLLMTNREAATQVLEQLRRMGVRFAIDDFGTGFSSLSYLQSFPFDKIKIDRSFVSSVANHKRSATLRRSIIQLGYNLGMTSVGEGVETEQQLNLLRAEGCIEAQGFLFSRAVPSETIRTMFGRTL